MSPGTPRMSFIAACTGALLSSESLSCVSRAVQQGPACRQRAHRSSQSAILEQRWPPSEKALSRLKRGVNSDIIMLKLGLGLLQCRAGPFVDQAFVQGTRVRNAQ